MANLLEQKEKEAENRCLELQEQIKSLENKDVKVHFKIVQLSEEDFAIGYIQEPSFIVKKRAMDKMAVNQSVTDLGEMILDTCFLKEASDKRILEDDKLHMTFIMLASEFVELYVIEVKKN